MKLPELCDLLIQTGFPVFYSHWEKSQEYPECPPPPYICYEVPEEPNFIADEKAYVPIKNVNVNLYTIRKDLSAEEKLEGLFYAAGLPWTADSLWVEKELLFEKTYYMGLI